MKAVSLLFGIGVIQQFLTGRTTLQTSNGQHSMETASMKPTRSSLVTVSHSQLALATWNRRDVWLQPILNIKELPAYRAMVNALSNPLFFAEC